MTTAAASPDPPPATLEEALAALAEARTALERAGREIDDLRRQVAWFQRNLFGRKSERRITDLPQPRESLFDAAGIRVDPEPAWEEPVEDAARAPAARRRGKKRRDRAVSEAGLRFDESVPVETVVLRSRAAEEFPEAELELVGEHVVHKLAQEPGSYRIIRYVTPIHKRRDTGAFLKAPSPPSVLESACADVSLLAGMLVDKFVWHLPLYRQHRRMEAAGVTLSRATLTNWSRRAIDLLEPVRDAQWESVLESRVVAMDETGIRAGRVARGRMRQAKLWPVYGDRDEIVFHYAPDRGHRHVPEILGDFGGVLLSDGYGAYESYVKARDGAVEHASCWAHARRMFEACSESEPKAAAEALELIWKLYKIEREIRKGGLEGEAKLAFRREASVPAMAEFWDWHKAQAEGSERLPRDPFLKALNYAGSRRAQLELCLSNPDVPIDTNHLERGVRPVACGRRNWLFACNVERTAMLSRVAPAPP